jgi:hypothetical protein
VANDIYNLWIRNLRSATARIIANAIAQQGAISDRDHEKIYALLKKTQSNQPNKRINAQDLNTLSKAILTGHQPLPLEEFATNDTDIYRNPLQQLQRWLSIYYMLSPLPLTYSRTSADVKQGLPRSLYTHLGAIQETLKFADLWDKTQYPEAQKQSIDYFVRTCVMDGYDQNNPLPEAPAVKKIIHLNRSLAALPQTFSALGQWIVSEKPTVTDVAIVTTITHRLSYVAPTWLPFMRELRDLQSLSLNSCTAHAIQFLLTPPHPFSSTLQWLSLDDCHLDEIPHSVYTFTQLKSLWLKDNNIRTIPTDLARFTRLTTLDLSKNPLPPLPDWLPSINATKPLQIYTGNS